MLSDEIEDWLSSGGDEIVVEPMSVEADRLRSAKGCLYGTLVSGVLWLMVMGTAWSLWVWFR